MKSKKLKLILILVLAVNTYSISVKADDKKAVNVEINSQQNQIDNSNIEANKANVVEIKKNTSNRGWVADQGKWYYFDRDGNTKVGWIELNGKWYFLNRQNGEMATGLIIEGGKEYYLNADGAMKIGWVKVNGNWYYFENSGAMKTGWLKSNNNWYLLKENGIMATDWGYNNGNWYGFNITGEMNTGWKKVGSNWYYLENSGAMKIGWIISNGKWYYLNNSGEMAVSWKNVGGVSYYFDNSGGMQTGWKEVSGKWYYLENSGAMKIGWFNSNGKWYYLKNNGEMATDWVDVNGTYYYLYKDGIMQSGWKQINGEWYYMENSGAMKTGWIDLNGKTYLLKSNGAMQTAWGEKDGKSYYFDKDGARQKDWLKIEDEKYYLDSQTGEKATYEWKVINGVTYWFNSNGTMANSDTIIKGEIYLFSDSGKYLGKGDKEEQLYVEMLSVGNADAIYMELPNGDDVLIDGGEYKDGNKVVEFLKGRNLAENDGIEDVDYVINTHPHSDHMGGLVEVFKNFKVNNFYYPHDIEMKRYKGFEGSESIQGNGYLINCMNYCYQFYTEAIQEAEKQGTKINDTISGSYIDDNEILKFIHPNKTYKQNNLDKPGELNGYDYCGFNNDSAVVYVNYGEFQMLLAADIEVEAEKDMIDMGLIPKNGIETLKVAHHGLSTSSSYEFLQKLSPEAGIISRAETTYLQTNLEKSGMKIFETWKSNSVKIEATKKIWNIYN